MQPNDEDCSHLNVDRIFFYLVVVHSIAGPMNDMLHGRNPGKALWSVSHYKSHKGYIIIESSPHHGRTLWDRYNKESERDPSRLMRYVSAHEAINRSTVIKWSWEWYGN